MLSLNIFLTIGKYFYIVFTLFFFNIPANVKHWVGGILSILLFISSRFFI